VIAGQSAIPEPEQHRRVGILRRYVELGHAEQVEFTKGE
jgi:hypothetical protein